MTGTSEPLRRATAVIELVAMEQGGLTVTAIATHLNLPVPTTYRLVQRLVDVGYLKGEGRHASYIAGPTLLRVARFVTESTSVTSLVKPMLQRIADELKVAAYLAGFFEGEVPLLQVTLPTNSDAPFVHPGPQFRVHASAGGKVLLAYQPEHVIDRFLSEPLEKLTERTVTDPSKLRVHLGEIRSLGYAVSSGESDPALWGIACPVLDAGNNVSFAVGVIGFRAAVMQNDSYISKVSPLLNHATRQIESMFERLGEAHPRTRLAS